MNWLIENIPAWNSFLGILLYWVPLTVCLLGYTMRTMKDIKKDVSKRAAADADPKNSYYSPTITIGKILGRLFASICPIWNLLAALFDIGGDLIGNIVGFLADKFTQPLVPARKKETDQ